MAAVLQCVRVLLASVAGLGSTGLALWNWLHYLTSPPPRIPCGNCFLGGVVLSAELSAIGMILATRILQRSGVLRGQGIWWFGAVLGASFTPEIVGLPLCAVSLVELVWPD